MIVKIIGKIKISQVECLLFAWIIKTVIKTISTPLKLWQCQSSQILFEQMFCKHMFVNKGKINTSIFFPMLHHEESPEKPQYNMATPYF